MYDSAATIAETLESVINQTYRKLDILVVDDGSIDEGPQIVARFAARDPRISLMTQKNAGVAAARNAGAKALDAPYLSFVDADDLWAPEKIALQLAALDRGGERIGLAYTWFSLIDENSRVISNDYRPLHEGQVLEHMCRGNFVGNGSSILLRRSVFDRIGGFDAALRAANAQGCEDLMICLKAAEVTEFALVPQHLVGYRLTHFNMSSDVAQMERSLRMVLGQFRSSYPQYAQQCADNQTGITNWLITRALQARRPRSAVVLYRMLETMDAQFAKRHRLAYVKIYAKSLIIPRWFKRLVRRALYPPFPHGVR